MILTDEIRMRMRIAYALRNVPEEKLACLLPCSAFPQPGDMVLTRLETIGKNTHLELTDGRRATLHKDDLLAVVFGNRYAPLQFEGYARMRGDRCDLLSMGGLCGLFESKHDSVAEPSRLRLLGAFGDAEGQRLTLQSFALPPPPQGPTRYPLLIAVCGTLMDAGKTHTAMSLIIGLRRHGYRVAAIKLTGTATGTDRWTMLDAGASEVLEFLDGGWPSTYLCTVEDLLDLSHLLLSHISAHGTDCTVIEIADGLLQRETAALLQTARFTRMIDAWVLAASDPLGVVGALSLLRRWQIEPLAISGRVSMSALNRQETEAATGLPCLTAQQLQTGEIIAQRLKARQHLSLPLLSLPEENTARGKENL
ncbi:DUF1611 domain-containing protein [Reticulibacter mediterranei]|uniref:DUF1611 domain-containing protein n=1 Tax=Reticulibacter mediterranei TaxID=2778369 RepID=A0A8J3N0D3_9CHLR|nr:hypothetical protein [Reticulibacter mediterranei]GHO90137.1 DUF1611 domain-containing protein [Reticulibacter mediterranei]